MENKRPIINFEKNYKKIITESVKRKIVKQISKEIQVAFLFAKKSKFQIVKQLLIIFMQKYKIKTYAEAINDALHKS